MPSVRVLALPLSALVFVAVVVWQAIRLRRPPLEDGVAWD